MNRETIINRDETGFNIRKIIEKSGLTFDAFAEILNLKSSRVIYDWVNGIKLPSTENLAKISSKFKVSFEDILSY